MTHGNPKGSHSTYDSAKRMHCDEAGVANVVWNLVRQGRKKCDITAKIAVEFGPRLSRSEPGPRPQSSRSPGCERQSDRTGKTTDAHEIELGESKLRREGDTTLYTHPATPQFLVLQHLVQVYIWRQRRPSEPPASDGRLAQTR
jgi:hypothetical protein